MTDETQHVPDGPLPGKPAAAESTGRTFGRYQVGGELGAGGMGTVYRAHDKLLGRDVAIKALTASGELGVRERFLREARAIGAVHHPNILAVHDVGEEGATPYLVMELAAGGSLRERIKAGPLSVDAVREVGVHIARALDAAHAAGIVHRDVKPGNILYSAAAWKLADFGIAHTPDSTLTMTGQFLGSPSYAAPESLRAGQFSTASDVYSLGATLYEALAGVPPHGDHDMQSLIRKLETDPTPLSERVPSAPRALTDAIMSALSRDPAVRPSAAQLADMLAMGAPAFAPPAFAPPPSSSSLPGTPPLNLAALGHAPTQASLVTLPAASLHHPHAGADAQRSSGLSMKLLGVGLLAIAVLATVLALRGGSSTSSSTAASPLAPLTPSEPQTGDPQAGDPEDGESPQPHFVDQYGNPVDDETAKQILQQMQQDADEASGPPGPPGNGRGHKKKHRDE